CEASGTILAAIPSHSLRNILVPDIPAERRAQIALLVQQSHAARKQAASALEKGKRAIEVAIEESQERAMALLQ
ncbi:MAG: hypothetical protein ACRD35_09030, partial [Candidatus Acidiferrales bacterium]